MLTLEHLLAAVGLAVGLVAGLFLVVQGVDSQALHQ
jgi:hypothetical protein